MNIEVVTDKVPASSLWISRDDCLHMGQKIFLRARGSSVGSHQFSRHHITAENEGACTQILVAPLSPVPTVILRAYVLTPGPRSTHPYSPCARPAWLKQARCGTPGKSF